jgi:tRNA threonylcarbamoyladenosine biosynthesis protein TsaB
MPSLNELRAGYSPFLLLDAASMKVQVGSLGGNLQTDRWATSTADAGVGIFECLAQLPQAPDDYRAFVFCHGPGSILGIRTVAMALRTWVMLKARPVFSYGSLGLVAEALGQPNRSIIADARRDLWHRYILGGGLQRVGLAELGPAPVMPAGFRHWSALPPDATTTPYHLPDLLAAVDEIELFSPEDAPDAFLHEEPDYKTWTPQVHRAP